MEAKKALIRVLGVIAVVGVWALTVFVLVPAIRKWASTPSSTKKPNPFGSKQLNPSGNTEPNPPGPTVVHPKTSTVYPTTTTFDAIKEELGAFFETFPKGYSAYIQHGGWKMHSERFADYLKHLHEPDFGTLSPNLMVGILIADYVCRLLNPAHSKAVEPVAEMKNLKLTDAVINALPVREILFLIPGIKEFSFQPSEKVNLEGLCHLKTLISVEIVGPHTIEFPYVLCKHPTLQELVILGANFIEIDFTNKDPFQSLYVLTVDTLLPLEKPINLAKGLPDLMAVNVREGMVETWKKWIQEAYGEENGIEVLPIKAKPTKAEK